MDEPCLTMDLAKIEHNARIITRLCARYGIAVTGVTKGTCGHPEVARAMLRGGVVAIGESRLENIHRLKSSGIETSYLLLRTPALSQLEDVVIAVDISLNSELAVIAGLAEAARRRDRLHKIIVMVDLGDLREGVWPDDLLAFVAAAVNLTGVRIVGLGVNLGCYGGVTPSVDNMRQLVEYACAIEQRFGLALKYLSGGSSSALLLMAAGKMPERINHLRIGEGILLGRETTCRMPWPDTFQDAFVLHAEIIELKHKPSLPVGVMGEDAFGAKPDFVDQGLMDRAILNIGREDVDVAGIKPVDPRFSIVGASSDHLIVDVTAAEGALRVGDELTFALNYSALLAAMTSRYVEKRSLG